MRDVRLKNISYKAVEGGIESSQSHWLMAVWKGDDRIGAYIPRVFFVHMFLTLNETVVVLLLRFIRVVRKIDR
jgi:hypothetical protein